MSSLFPDTPHGEAIDLADAALIYYATLPFLDSQGLLEQLIETTPWQQEDITLFGATHPQPRLIAWYGDPGATYTYSNVTHAPLPWTPSLDSLRRQVERVCESTFNSVLLNYYRDGRDSMGLHADDEPELGAQPFIASLSLGAVRRMYFRHKRRRDLSTLSIDLADGSLLVMHGDTQANWKHGIRRTTKPCGPRVNLTFRRIVGA